MDTFKEPLLGKTLLELQLITQQLGMPRFAAKQIASWLYDKKVSSIDEMTNLSLKAREVLCQQYTVGATAPVEAQRSSDGTVKYLFRTEEGNFIETVYIPDDPETQGCRPEAYAAGSRQLSQVRILCVPEQPRLL